MQLFDLLNFKFPSNRQLSLFGPHHAIGCRTKLELSLFGPHHTLDCVRTTFRTSAFGRFDIT